MTEGGGRILPGGVVTFVFTDIEGSTALFRSLGDEYPPLLEQHQEILRAVWKDHGGVEVDTEGDAFFVAFADADAAIVAAVDGTERLAAHDWPDGGAIRVRIGMHTGVAHPRNGRYVAFPVHQAARIGGVGHGGQVVISPQTAALVGDLGDIALHDLGAYRVRDFDDAIHLFQAERSISPTEHAPLRTSADVQHNLSSDLPTLHGREADVTGISEQLAQSRLVTIVGPGGVGKTLMARTLGLRDISRFADGAWFVDLAAHHDGSTMTGAIADVLDVAPDDLDAHLAERTLLLILDNAEQAVADVARLAARLLDRSPGLSILVTSREPLAVAAERVWRLDLMDDAAAIALFLERARATAPDIDHELELDAIESLCRRLDGLPLAIELAASRITALSVAEIAESLDDRMRVLRSRRRDLDDRQRTASALVDWSYRLLDEDEQLVFRRLGLFAGSFDVEAATIAANDSGLDRIDISEILWSLVEKSLVMPVIGDGATRYRLLETLRAFAHDAMQEIDELTAARARIAGWYRERFDPCAPFTRVTALSLRDELDNVRGLAADVAESDPSSAQWLAWSIGLYFKTIDPARGMTELMPLVARLSVRGEAVVGMLAVVAHLANNRGDVLVATELLDRADELSAGEDRPTGAGWVQNVRALNAVRNGDLRHATEILESARPDAEGLELVSIENSLGIVCAESDDLEQALTVFESLLVRADETGALDAAAVATGAVAEIWHRFGELERAMQATTTVLELGAQSGMRSQHAMGVVGAARLMADTGDDGTAVVLHTGADRILAETGQNLFPADRELSDRMLATARDRLGEHRFEWLAREGRNLTDLDLHARAMASLRDAIRSESRAVR